MPYQRNGKICTIDNYQKLKHQSVECRHLRLLDEDVFNVAFILGIEDEGWKFFSGGLYCSCFLSAK